MRETGKPLADSFVIHTLLNNF